MKPYVEGWMKPYVEGWMKPYVEGWMKPYVEGWVPIVLCSFSRLFALNEDQNPK